MHGNFYYNNFINSLNHRQPNVCVENVSLLSIKKVKTTVNDVKQTYFWDKITEARSMILKLLLSDRNEKYKESQGNTQGSSMTLLVKF